MTCVSSAFDLGVPQYQSDLVLEPASAVSEAGTPVADASGGSSSCGAVCAGVTLAEAPVSSIATVSGTWSLCGGQLPIQGRDLDGFPADTAGIQFDPTTNSAYVLVAGDGGILQRGVGPTYQWSVTVNMPLQSLNPNITDFGFHNPVVSSSIDGGSHYPAVYDVTFFPAADGCAAAMHMTNVYPGMPAYQSDFVLVAP
jgi:hypothetical protein